MLTRDQINDAVERLHRAEQAHEQIRALTLSHTRMDMDDAYAIQSGWVARKLAEAAG